MAIVDAAREGASRRFRGVMMTAVSFIIGVLAILVAPRAGAPSPPHKRTKGFIRIDVATLVGLLYKNAP
ncbi:hypothetical protein ACVGWV_14850, partial [Enterobacter asburiae]